MMIWKEEIVVHTPILTATVQTVPIEMSVTSPNMLPNQQKNLVMISLVSEIVHR